VTCADLENAEAIWAGNAVRGLIRCRLDRQAASAGINEGP
jgi:hypothetical protein